MLEQLDLPVTRARPEPSRRPRERLPDAVAELLEEQHLATRPLDRDRAATTRVSLTTHSVSPGSKSGRSRKTWWATLPVERV